MNEIKQFCNLKYHIDNNNEITIVGCDNKTTEVVIPSEIDGYTVTSIGWNTFRDCTSLTSITLPEGVTSIGVEAFRNCSSLKSIIIPNSVTSIGSYAFEGCSSLTSITIPNSVTFIGNGAFRGCTSLNNIIVDENNIIYDSRDNCNAIINSETNELITGCKDTIIPNSVTSIGSYAFKGCTSLTNITIPDTVTSIGYGAFKGCTSLESVAMGKGVRTIGSNAFSGCESLNKVNIQDVKK